MGNYYGIVRSPDYLEHFGVLGMKWGVWNAETRARREGRPEKKELTPEEIAAKKQKRAETAKKIFEGAKKVAAVTYDIAKIAMSIYLAKQLTALSLNTFATASMQATKVMATADMATNGMRFLSSSEGQNALNTLYNTVNTGANVAYDPSVQQFMNAFSTINSSQMNQLGSSFASGFYSTAQQAVANGQAMDSAVIDEYLRSLPR